MWTSCNPELSHQEYAMVSSIVKTYQMKRHALIVQRNTSTVALVEAAFLNPRGAMAELIVQMGVTKGDVVSNLR